MTARRISVVLPVYNEAENIPTSLRGLWAALKDLEHEILVCYDFDADTTLPAIAAMPDAPPTVRLVKNDIGRGAANAIRAGFAAATGDVVVTTMADLSDPPDRIPALAAKLREDDLAVVAGSRYMPGGSQTGGPLLKRTFSRWAGLILRALAGIGTHDVTSNFRAYSRSFLATTRVESKAGFEIALELTTKAHNAGLGVGEVASSWRDRSAGTSRFRMWKWMPNYLRWWLTAAIAPAFVWAVLLASAATGWHMARTHGDRAAIHAAVVVVGALLGGAAILGLRRSRGRTLASDVVQAALWAHPWHAELFTGGWAAVDAGVTSALAAAHGWWTLGTHSAHRVLARARRGAAGVGQAELGLVLLAALFVVARFVRVEPAATTDLDDSWQQIIGNAFARGDQWGRDVVFTFGPLGYFTRGTFIPELYWWKVLWWELGLKALVALGLVFLTRRMSGPLERGACILALFGASGGFDTLNFLAIVAGGAWLIATPAAGVVATAGVLGVLSLIALTKFTSFVLFAACVIAIALARRWRGGWKDTLRSMGLSAAVFLACWTVAAGQNPLHIPAWIRTSLWIASGHNQAMSSEGEFVARDESDAWILLSLAGFIAVFSAIESARDATRWIASGLFAFATFVAFKAGFTRHGGNSITFFAFAAAAPWFLLPARAPGQLARFTRPVLVGLRIACSFTALMALARLFGNPQALPSQPFVVFLNDLERNLPAIAGASAHEERLEVLRDTALKSWDMPAARALVGSEPVDHFFFDQGIALLNGFDFRQRPVIQSYVAYTPELARLNADYYLGERAPRFVLYRHSTLDGRLPGLEDGPAQLILARDYRLVLAENGTLVLARDPRVGASEPAPLLERTIGFDETVEVAGLAPGDVLARFDVDLSAAGERRRLLLRAPIVWIDVDLDDGRTVRHRFEPGMARSRFLLSPHLDSNGAAERYFLGEGGERVRAFRLRVEAADREYFDPTIRLQLFDGAGWAPRPVDAAAYAAASAGRLHKKDEVREFEVSHPALGTQPMRVRTIREPEHVELDGARALLTSAPFEVEYALAPQVHLLRARFSVPEYSWRWTTAKGFGLIVALRDAAGREERLAYRSLDPDHYEKDRGPIELFVELPPGEGRRLYIRVRPGLSNTLGKDLVAWSSIAFE